MVKSQLMNLLYNEAAELYMKMTRLQKHAKILTANNYHYES